MKKVRISYSQGVGALCHMRNLECDVDDEKFEELIEWAKGGDKHQHSESSLELVKKDD